MKKTNIKNLILSISIPLIGGILVGVITGGSQGVYQNLCKPPLSPPGAVFPIVWSILYILMGIAFYLINKSGCKGHLYQNARYYYIAQLIVNYAWPIIFFSLGLCCAAVICFICLIALVLLTFFSFRKIDKTAALLLVPYLAWCAYALYLNIGVCILN